MNPYEKYLNGRDPIEVMSETPTRLKVLVDAKTPEQLDVPLAAGKWSLREMLAHFADCELNWAIRIRQVLANPGCTIVPFDQDVWATRYAAYSADLAMTTFLSQRAWNLALLTTVSDDERSYLVTHPERGTFPVTELLESIAGHDLHHLTHLQA